LAINQAATSPFLRLYSGRCSDFNFLIPAAIGSETALSFLGLGILPPAVSWGVMVRDAQTIEAITTYPWMLLPVLVLIITVLSFYLLGDGIRDAVDPYA
jgi:peptide/nickel transport system permease protein